MVDAVVGSRVHRVRCEDGDAGALAHHLQLVDRVRALQVGGDQHRLVPLLAQPAPELAGQRRLAGALQAGEQDHGRRGLGQLDPPGLPAEHADELVVDDLDDLLRGVERLGDLHREGALAHGRRELAHDAQRDDGVEQGTADLADRGVDVGRGQPALAPQRLEGRGEAV